MYYEKLLPWVGEVTSMRHGLLLPAVRFLKHYFRRPQGAKNPAGGYRCIHSGGEKAVYLEHSEHRYEEE